MEQNQLSLTDTYKNLQSVSFWFLVVIASLHFITGLLVANQLAIKSSWLINRLLDLPFFIVSYIYFASLIRLRNLPLNNNLNFWDLLIASLGLISIIGLQTYDLIFPNLLP